MATRDPTQDPACQICSKPIRSESFVLREHGEMLHVRCRSQILQVEVMETVDHAKAAHARAARLVEQTRQRRRTQRQCPCPVCGEPASILDWRPSVPWLAVDGCRCNGFFLWTPLLDPRLRGMTVEDRAMLGARIRCVRQTGREAWLLTEDDTPAGPLVVRDERPDQG